MDELQARIPDGIYKTNIDCLKTIILLNETELQEKTNLNYKDAVLVLQETAAVLIQSKIKKVADVPEWNKLLTGCESIDILTKSGIPSNGITEIYGSSGVGKTQLCLQLSLMVQLPKVFGGLEKGAIYICTEDLFPIKRLYSLCSSFKERINCNVSNFQDNIYIEHITDFEQLRQCLYVRLNHLLQQVPIGLIIVDSIAAAFRSETTNYVNRSEQLHLISNKLRQFANKYNLIVICINQVTDNPNTGQVESCLGYSWKNLITNRFEISRKSIESCIRTFTVINAPHLAKSSCNFILKNDGLKAAD